MLTYIDLARRRMGLSIKKAAEEAALLGQDLNSLAATHLAQPDG